MEMVSITTATTMKALVTHRPGKPAALQVEEVPVPEVPDNGVRLRVHASSVNPVDLFPLTRPGNLRGKALVLGTDFAGTIESVGKSVTGFAAGDEVFGGKRGAFAEYLAVTDDAPIVHKPAGVSFEDAASLPVAATTALQALRHHGRIERGHKVLINGASGGVGTFAVQVAKVLGAEVTAVCSTRNVEIVRGIGADRVLDYTREDFTRSGDVYDLMIDIAGNRAWSECARVLRPRGAYVGVGAASVQHGEGGGWRAIGHFLEVRVRSIGSGLRVVALFITRLRKADLETLGDMVASGRVKPVIDRRYDLAGVPEALAYLEDGHSQGKVAIAIDG
jgi:NADPH:quinone reductase-like Zn-dependent oxidoreductase